MCPLLLFRLTRPICLAPETETTKRIKLVEPPTEKVWGFGVLFVTLSIVVSMGGLIVVPFLNRDARRTILTLFEGLAVGGLVGSAVIHLFPKAYNITQETFQQYFSRIFFIFGGIYMFYVIERVLKILTTMRKSKNKKAHVRRRTSSFGDHLDRKVTKIHVEENIHNSVPSLSPIPTSTLAVIETSFQRPKSSSVKSAQVNSPADRIDKCLASVKKSSSHPLLTYHGVYPSKTSLNQPSLAEAKSVSIASKQTYVPDIAGRREDHDTATSRLHTDSVACEFASDLYQSLISAHTVVRAGMIVLGDASLNFIDGLSIGAAFDRNILAGISISVAVMLEEVPHRTLSHSIFLFHS